MHHIIDLTNGLLTDFENQLLQLKDKESPSLALKGALPFLKQIKQIISKHNLCYLIELVESQHSIHQLTIDELIWHNQHYLAQQQMANPLAEKKPKSPTILRTRPRPKHNQPISVQIDVDVAFQTEVVAEFDIEQNVEESTESLDIPHIDFDQFNEILQKHSDIATSSLERHQLWYRTLGMIAVLQKGNKTIDVSEDEDVLRDISIDFSQVKSKTHIMVKGMSEDAAKAIAIHPNSFVDGMDYRHLPKGFRLVRIPDTDDEFTLDFQDTDKPNYDVLAISVLEPKENLPISKNVADKWLHKAKESTKQLLSTAHKALLEKHYDSKDLQIFRQNLPVLLSLNLDSLASLFNLCHDESKGHLSGKKLYFYLRNQAKCLKMMRSAAERAEFGDKQAHIKTFCYDKVFQSDAISTHPWALNIEESSQSFLRNLNEYYHFSRKQLDSLWYVQATKGDVALNQVLNTLHELQPKNDQSYLFFQHVDDLSQLLDKQPWQAAFKRLTAMDEQQRAWWDALVKKHMTYTDEVDMLNLLKQFTQFSRQIHGLNLKFYTPVNFEHVRSMPVALTRMLAIINNCQHENIEQQWACMTNLPLQASGAIRAIEESSIKQPCSFVTPEMALTAEYYEFREENDKGYQSAASAKGILEYMKRIKEFNGQQETTIPSSDDTTPPSDTGIKNLIFYPDEESLIQTALRGLYRYLAWANYKAPLSFYKKAVHNLDDIFSGVEWENLTLSFAYIVMSGATTGLINSAKSRQRPEQTHEDLVKLMTHFKFLDKFPTWLNSFGAKPWVRLILLGLFALLEVNPDPRETHSLVGLFDRIFEGLTLDWQWVFNFSDKVNNIIQPLNNMQPLLLEGDSNRLKAFLNSIRFIGKADLEQLTFHLSEIRALGEMLQGSPISSKEDLAEESWNVAKKITEILEDSSSSALFLKLIALKTQFGITYENMHQLQQLNLNNPTALYALDLLSQMTDNDSLDIKQLISFIQALPEPMEADSSHVSALNYESVVTTKMPQHTINYKKVHQLIKKDFGQHFNEDFFKSLSDVALDKTTIEQIKDVLPPSIARDTCLNFFKRFPKNEHAELVSNLLILAKQMKGDKAEFILALSDDNLFSFKDAEQLKKILNVLDENGDSKSWLFILRALKSSKDDNPGFSDFSEEALTFWLSHLMPQLNKILEQMKFLPANVYEVIYSGFEADFRYNNVDKNTLKRTAAIWKKFCQELTHKPIACETILALVQSMINKGAFSHKRIEDLCFLGQYIEDKTDLSLATYFLNNHIDILHDLLDKLHSTTPTSDEIKLIVSIIEKQANAGLNIDQEVIAFLFNADNHSWLKQLYATPPYPDIYQVITWSKAGSVMESYRQYCFSPCDRNDPGNGFYHEDAYMKALEQIAFTPGLEITPSILRGLQQEATKTKLKTIEQLKEQLTSVVTSNPINYEKLTTICAELLHRSMGREGNTYELNETQYLAVYKALRDQSLGPLTGKFDSGEGKTRVFMVIAGALLAQGKTVDFITRNMTLAKREYLTYQSYFDLLDAKTAVIHSQSKVNEYQPGQINFSDVSQFSLFMNQQLSQNKDPRVPKQDRALLLDEADQTYFDAFLTRYNYATTTVNFGASMNWIYDILVEFFQITEHQNLYYDDINKCNETFRDYVDNHVTEKQMQQLLAVNDEQIETWHDSAMRALQLSYEHDFNLSLDEVISVPGKGRQLFSRAIVVKDNREQRESSFANGVQQCLHARLNWLRKHPDNSAFSEEIAKSQHPFVIRPESDIIYFNTSKGFLDDYKDCTFIALTGSDGSDLEKVEVQALLNMAFIEFPRHNKLRREDLPLRLCRNEDAQLEAIVENIRMLKAANQPALIICEDDKESARLTEKLTVYFKEESMTRIHSGCTSEVEQKHADIVAGKPGHITISTDMYGRGVDIKLHNKAKENGLGVLLTYMPGSEREYIQSISRSGRYGCHGTSRMIINKQRLLKKLSISSLPSSFFIHSGIPERKAMADLNLPKQRKRLVTVAITDFQRQLEKVFFAHHFDKDEKTQNVQLKAWTRFDKTIRQMWDKKQHELEKLLAQKPIQEDKIGKTVDQYGTAVKLLWQKTFPGIDIAQSNPNVAAVFSKINAMEPTFKLKKPVFSHYDRSHDGFAVLYDHWFAETRAWWRGERCLFANTRAWLRGEGTIFANLQAWWRGDITLWELLFPVGLEKEAEKKMDTILMQPSLMVH